MDGGDRNGGVLGERLPREPAGVLGRARRELEDRPPVSYLTADWDDVLHVHLGLTCARNSGSAFGFLAGVWSEERKSETDWEH